MKTFFSARLGNDFRFVLRLQLLCICIASSSGAAKALEIRISASHDLVSVGEDIELSVEFTQRKTGNLSNLKMPQFRGFVERGRTRSNSSSVKIINGRRTMETRYTFNIQLTAERPGTHQLGPARASLDGQKAISNKVTVRVVGQASAPKSVGNAAMQPGITYLQDVETRYDNRPLPRTLVHVDFDKTEAVVGEQITATVRVLSTENLANVSRPEYPKLTNFLTEGMDQPTQIVPTPVQLRGQDYQSYLIERTALFPLEAGSQRLANVALEVNMTGGFFRRGKKLNLKSQAYTLDIKNLPATGQPPNFPIHNVGQWNLSAEVDRNRTKRNEPITLKLIATGEGSARQLKMPAVASNEAYRAFPPTFSESTNASSGRVLGMKTSEILIQPKTAGRLILGPFALSYFDPVRKTYTQSQSAALSIRVDATPADREERNLDDRSQQPLRPLALGLELDRPQNRLFQLRDLVTVWVFGWLVCLALCLVLALRRQKTSSEAYAQAQARSHRTQRLKEAEQNQDVGIALETVYDHLAARYGERVKSLPIAELSNYLQGLSCPSKRIAEIVDWLQAAQEQRYAPTGNGAATDLFAQAKRLLKDIDGEESNP